MIKILAALIPLAFVGCTTPPNKKFAEPMHTQFMLSCIIQGGFIATTCECQENIINEMIGEDNEFNGFTPPMVKRIIKECKNIRLQGPEESPYPST